MANLVYGIPFVEFKIAATAKIKNVANGIYGAGTLAGSLVTPASKKLQGIHDQRAAPGSLLPYFAWGAKTGTLSGAPHAVFGQAAVVQSVTAHVYSSLQGSTDEVDELCDRLAKLFHHQSLALTGYTTQEVSFDVIDIIPDPVGQHGIVVFRPLNRVSPV